MKCRKFLVLILILIIAPKIPAQKADAGGSKDFFSNVAALSRYLASNNFLQKRKRVNDVKAVDIIYEKSLAITGSVSEALLTATFATLPFKYFPLVLPLSGLRIYIPLPVGPLNIFKKKIRRLPSHFFFDTPATPAGDVDKLAHFFANAFLVYNLEYFGFSDFLGRLVELFERNFKVNGTVDTRDIIVNKLGAFFGKELIKNKSVLPSIFFVIYDLNFLMINSTSP